MYQSGETIHQLLTHVANGDYVLPAIQREFVWEPEQICKLFDSLMQGYPFGTFLFWKIRSENREQYQFYDFMLHFHERDAALCLPKETLSNETFIAVLDGQQRITALNIGLRGSFSEKLKNKQWRNKDAFPRKYLYLNLFGAHDPENGSQYQFKFLTEAASKVREPGFCWFRVGEIYGKAGADWHDLEDALGDELEVAGYSREDRRVAKAKLRDLHTMVHTKPFVTFYQEEEQNLERVLNIFIRLNAGGTPLSYSDLLLSIAVTQWQTLDARQEIRALVKEMNDTGGGFAFSKDLVLKAGLMLSDIGSVQFKVENFNKENMARLEANWPKVRDSLLLAVRLVSEFGFRGQTLSADSPILPIAYYLHQRGFDERYLTQVAHAEDRESLRDWLLRSLLKASGIWGSGLDTLLAGLRGVLQAHGRDGFPKAEIERHMESRGKSLKFSEEEVLDLAELDYGHKLTFPLLSMLFPGHDPAREVHVDHIFPIGRFKKPELKRVGVEEAQFDEFQDKANRLPNLQLLLGSLNNEKRKRMPHEWICQYYPSGEARERYLEGHAIQDLPESLLGFPVFYDRRKTALEHRIRMILLKEPEGPRASS